MELGNKSVHNHGGSGGGGGGEIANMKLVVRHKDLAQIVACIKYYLEKAVVAGEPVSNLLEISRAHLNEKFVVFFLNEN